MISFIFENTYQQPSMSDRVKNHLIQNWGKYALGTTLAGLGLSGYLDNEHQKIEITTRRENDLNYYLKHKYNYIKNNSDRLLNNLWSLNPHKTDPYFGEYLASKEFEQRYPNENPAIKEANGEYLTSLQKLKRLIFGPQQVNKLQ